MQLTIEQNKKHEEIMVLERETTLMATAYHDQASRLQLNSVVLLRRSDAPASWLNKQRNALDSSVVRL
jgi:protein HOOK3